MTVIRITLFAAMLSLMWVVIAVISMEKTFFIISMMFFSVSLICYAIEKKNI